MTTSQKYSQLVDQMRKDNSFPDDLINFQKEKPNTFKHTNLFANWHGNLEAQVMVIGQDWGDMEYFGKNNGHDIDNEKTSSNLHAFFKSIGIDIGLPSLPNARLPLYFTNVVAGIKLKDKSGPIKPDWIAHGMKYLATIIEIINPKVIVTLGGVPYSALKKHLYSKELRGNSFNAAVQKTHIDLGNDKLLVPMYHPAARAVNRTYDQQVNDWKRLKPVMEANGLMKMFKPLK